MRKSFRILALAAGLGVAHGAGSDAAASNIETGDEIRVAVETACSAGSAVFNVINLGAALPDHMRFIVSRATDGQIVRVRKNTLASRGSVRIVVPGVAETGTELALSLDPSWVEFTDAPVARIRCAD